MLAGNPQIEVIIVLPLVIFVVVVLLWRTSSFAVAVQSAGRLSICRWQASQGRHFLRHYYFPGSNWRTLRFERGPKLSPCEPTLSSARSYIPELLGATTPGKFRKSQGYFEEQWVYVGAIALALAVVAVALRWRRARRGQRSWGLRQVRWSPCWQVSPKLWTMS